MLLCVHAPRMIAAAVLFTGPPTATPHRIAYGFDRLRFTLGGADGLALPLPVPAAARAGGWTSLAALALLRDGSALRVMVNSRGDTLILQRSPSSAS